MGTCSVAYIFQQIMTEIEWFLVVDGLAMIIYRSIPSGEKISPYKGILIGLVDWLIAYGLSQVVPLIKIPVKIPLEYAIPLYVICVVTIFFLMIWLVAGQVWLTRVKDKEKNLINRFK